MAKRINLCSWNVNGLRAVSKKNFADWALEGTKNKGPWHIIGLQETKLKREQVPTGLLEQLSDYELHTSDAQRAGYSGVALFIHKKIKPIKIFEGIGNDKFDCEGRTLTLITENFIAINAYYPNGQRDHGRVDYKLEFSQAVLDMGLNLKKEHKLPLVLMGDFNTAHQEIDLKNPKTNQKTTGFLPIEREWIDKLLASGMKDIFRDQHPNQEGHYTWWTYRNNCRAKNVGWRIDYFFTCPEVDKLKPKAEILSEVLGSDHCPISLHLNV